MESDSRVGRSRRCGSCYGPRSLIEAEQIVEKYAGKEPEVLRDDFLNSLLAAYRPTEIMEQLVSVNMDPLHMEVVTDRHFIVFGSMS